MNCILGYSSYGNDGQVEEQFDASFAIRLRHSSSLLTSPNLSSMPAASVSMPALSAGEERSWGGRCRQAIIMATACSLSPL